MDIAKYWSLKLEQYELDMTSRKSVFFSDQMQL